jgi:hypothetical protein
MHDIAVRPPGEHLHAAESGKEDDDLGGKYNHQQSLSPSRLVDKFANLDPPLRRLEGITQLVQGNVPPTGAAVSTVRLVILGIGTPSPHAVPSNH